MRPLDTSMNRADEIGCCLRLHHVTTDASAERFEDVAVHGMYREENDFDGRRDAADRSSGVHTVPERHRIIEIAIFGRASLASSRQGWLARAGPSGPLARSRDRRPAEFGALCSLARPTKDRIHVVESGTRMSSVVPSPGPVVIASVPFNAESRSRRETSTSASSVVLAFSARILSVIFCAAPGTATARANSPPLPSLARIRMSPRLTGRSAALSAGKCAPAIPARGSRESRSTLRASRRTSDAEALVHATGEGGRLRYI